LESSVENQRRTQWALFRLAVLGELVHAQRSRGELTRALRQKAHQHWQLPNGQTRKIAAKTIQSWYYRHRQHGFDGLLPRERRDRGTCKSIPAELQTLIVEMKREDPGRSVPLTIRELESTTSFTPRGLLRASTVGRLLRERGSSGPKSEQKIAARYRFVAATCGELWQGDACHGPSLFDPSSGRMVRAKVFGLIDDKSRVVPVLRASFHETQEDFLQILQTAILRRGRPRGILLDNHGSFTGADVRLACAKLGIRLIHARPYDGASKGKIERFWRTLRANVLDRLDLDRVLTLDDLNVRMMSWVDGDYHQRPHSGLSGQTPLSVWEEDLTEIRWIDDPSSIDAAFLRTVTRRVRKDSTCPFRGTTYETPPELRGRTVELHYNLFDPSQVWVMDGPTMVFLREVDPVANSRRARIVSPPGVEAAPSRTRRTGLNAVEDTLQRVLRPAGPRDSTRPSTEESCDA
jgi:transposase InsO family protein